MTTADKKDESFLSRWSRRKVDVARGVEASVGTDASPSSKNEATPEGTNSSIGAPSGAKMPQDARPERTLPAPTVAVPLPPIESMTAESDFAPFMQVDVAPEMRNLAMKKLFTDPHYNVMDRLDIYIDDYGKEDPIPPAVLRMMNQSKALGLFEDEEREEEAARKAALGEPDADAPAIAAPHQAAHDSATAAAATAEIAPGAEAAAAENESFPFAPQATTARGSST